MFRERRRIHVINPKLSASRATADTHAQGERRTLPLVYRPSFLLADLAVLPPGCPAFWFGVVVLLVGDV